MKILIAEDELLERKAMTKFIRDNFKDMEVVGEAVNGRKAIELAQTLQPDIIFMDIKMPGINGLEAIEQIHAVQPKIKFVLVSAYDTFDYAKQAMHFGIRDYILKPGNKEEITNALFRLKQEIANEAKIEEEKQQSEKLLKESLIRKLMKQPVDEGIFELQNQLFPRIKSSYFFVMSTDDTYDLQHIKTILARHLQNLHIVYEANDSIVVLVQTMDLVKKSDQINVARKIQMEIGENMFIGIGNHSESLEQLPISYRTAYVASFQLKMEKKSNCGFIREDEKPSDHEPIIAQIIGAMERGNDSEVIRVFKEHEDLLAIEDKENIYIMIQNLFSRRNIVMSTGSISTLQSSKDWHSYLTICCMKMNDYSQSQQSMTKAKEFIEAHFPTAITLEEVADLVNLSPNYFSNLFKEEYGETFIEFLTKTRMEKAKELIEENVYSLKEISYKVGYRDPNYFSRVFKRYYASSPRQFQDGIFGK